ncbi:uncharacterized protein LOC134710519 [Mytilus trossulus]|uniref:uncharacterized protein LOC134710519 n=1 Tax=Mytilus trossulus TaxID=6551 RepID=UPI003006683E
MSPILFLLAIDWIQRNTRKEVSSGPCLSYNQLEDLNFADDIAILSTTSEHLQEKSNILNNYAKQTGLNVNAKKTKVISINTRNTTPITINDLPVDSVEDFTYLGSIISKDNGTGKDIKARLSKARLQDLIQSGSPTSTVKDQTANL